MASNYGYGQYAAYGYAQATQAAHIGYGMMLGATPPAQQATVGYGQQLVGATTPNFTPPQPVRPMATPTQGVVPSLPTTPGTNQASYYNYQQQTPRPAVQQPQSNYGYGYQYGSGYQPSVPYPPYFPSTAGSSSPADPAFSASSVSTAVPSQKKSVSASLQTPAVSLPSSKSYSAPPATTTLTSNMGTASYPSYTKSGSYTSSSYVQQQAAPYGQQQQSGSYVQPQQQASSYAPKQQTGSFGQQQTSSYGQKQQPKEQTGSYGQNQQAGSYNQQAGGAYGQKQQSSSYGQQQPDNSSSQPGGDSYGQQTKGTYGGQQNKAYGQQENKPYGYQLGSYGQVGSYGNQAQAYGSQMGGDGQQSNPYEQWYKDANMYGRQGTSYSSYNVNAQPQDGSGFVSAPQRVLQQFIKHRSAGGTMKTFQVGKKPAATHPPSQEFYCETCKVSCSNSLTMKMHMDGKNHKKKLAQVQQQQANPPPATSFKCELCDIFCSNKDAYEAHMRGAKHLKTVNLHRRLGKPIPPMTTAVATTKGAVQVTGPRITFVGGKKLSSTGLTPSTNPSGDEVNVYPAGAVLSKSAKAALSEKSSGAAEVNGDDDETVADVEPVGLELVKAVKGDVRAPHAGFLCELCECFFNDEQARVMHCKGRRHRLNYKKKYQPDLVVLPSKSHSKSKSQRSGSKDPSGTNNKGAPGRGGAGRGMGVKKQSNKPHTLDELRQMEADAIAQMQYPNREGDHGHMDPGYDEFQGDFYNQESFGYEEWPLAHDPHFPLPIRNPMDDRMVSGKHGQLFPQDSELKAVQQVCTDVEKALKMVSDDFLTERCNSISAENVEDDGDQLKPPTKDESLREIKGVMRVGHFAKGLMLKGDLTIELVVMCAGKPTKDLLHETVDLLCTKLTCLGGENIYNVTADPKRAGFVVISQVKEHMVTVLVTFTSLVMSDDDPDVEPSDDDIQAEVLDRSSCLSALSELRHAKWFQSVCKGLPSFVIICRVLMDMRRRVPDWAGLSSWIIELLVQKCIVTANPDFSRPGDIFRRVIECMASGLFLPGSPGIMDPCQKGTIDATASLTVQERLDLTVSAQQALRLISFNQLHRVLGVEPLPEYAAYSTGGRAELTSMEVEEELPAAKRPKIEE